MKLQLRFFLVLAAVFFAAASFLLLQQKFEVDRSKSVLASELKQRKTYLQNIISLDGNGEQTLIEDYTFWDDFVTFLKTNDVTFAHQNLDTALGTFNVDADWVYRPNNTLLYFSSADGTNTLKAINLPQSFFQRLSTTKFAHFYRWVQGNLLEIRAATIVPTADPQHATPAQGFFVIGRVLNRSYTSTLATLSGSSVSIGKPSAIQDRTTSDTVSFGENLIDWNGQSVASLRSTSTVAVISDLRQQYDRQLEVLAMSTAISIAGIGALLWWLVLRPVSIVNRAIKQQQPLLLQGLASKHTEFGRLAQTVADFFQQKIRLAEAEFKRSELEKLNKEKSSFLAVAAHELNTPVTNVKLFSEYLSFLLHKDREETAIEKQLHRIEHQTTKINMLLNDLRAASSGKQGLEFNFRDFDFDTFLQEEVEEAGFSIKHKLNLTGTTQIKLHSDPDRLGQVVSNLIRNAAKYSPDGGDISILAAVKDGAIVVSVQDHGVGIAPDDIPHLFERFYRSAQVSTSFPGLGLGLYISKNIIEGLGGRMWVESQLGKGSTFYFSLPLPSSTAAPATLAAYPSSSPNTQP